MIGLSRLTVGALLVTAWAMCAGQAKDSLRLPAYLPVPSDLEVSPPAAGLPAETASFSGVWFGSWYGERTNTLMAEQAIVVTKIDASSAKVFYGGVGRWGDISGLTWQWTLDGEVSQGVLKFTLPNRARTVVTCKVNEDGSLSVRGESAGGTWVGKFARR